MCRSEGIFEGTPGWGTARKSRWSATGTYRFPTLVLLAALSATGLAASPQVGLEGTRWVLAGWSVSSISPAEFEITAEFRGNRISGRSAVNHYSGTVELDEDGKFEVGAVAVTRMAGPEPAMQAEEAYLRLLEEVRRYRWSGEKLVLVDRDDNILLEFRLADAEPFP